MISNTFIAMDENNAVLGDDLNQVCQNLRTLSERDYQLSEQRKNDPHVLPMNKNQFLRLLKKSIENTIHAAISHFPFICFLNKLLKKHLH